jgi:hypothetical protein
MLATQLVFRLQSETGCIFIIGRIMPESTGWCVKPCNLIPRITETGAPTFLALPVTLYARFLLLLGQVSVLHEPNVRENPNRLLWCIIMTGMNNVMEC